MKKEKQKFQGQIVKGNEQFQEGQKVTAEYINHIEVELWENEKGLIERKEIIKDVTGHKINGTEQKFLIHKPTGNITIKEVN